MSEFKLTQTGQQVQADLDKIEQIHSNDNTFTGTNTFTGETKLEGVIKDANEATGSDGEVLTAGSNGKAYWKAGASYVITSLTETTDEIEIVVASA